MTNKIDFTNEATLKVLFKTDGDFSTFREWAHARYSRGMVRVERGRVRPEGTIALVHHSRGLGAELKGNAFANFKGVIL
jgi:hypothetical protein